MTNRKTNTDRPGSSNNTDIDGNVNKSVVIDGDNNQVNIEIIEKKPTSETPKRKRARKSNQKKKGFNLFGAIGITVLIFITLIIWYAIKERNFLASPTVPTASITETSSPTPTDTATSEPTFTAVPADTPTETPLPTATLVPPVTIGEDWSQGCISQLWQAYPPVELEAKGNGCWREPVYAFSADNGSLYFLSERDGGDAELYGMFMPLPESGNVTFTIRLEALENADLLMGVFPEPNVESAGLLMVIPNGDVERNVVLQKNPRTYETMQGTVALYQGDGYSLSFTFTTLSVISRVNPNIFVTNQVSIQKPQKWLFLGYKGLRGAYRIEGSFLNFEIRE